MSQEDDDLRMTDVGAEGADDVDGPETKPSFKELQNVRLGRLGEGVGGRQKSLRTAEEATIAKMWGVLSGGAYSDIPEGTKTKLVDDLVQTLGKRIAILNVEALIAAAVWRTKYPKLSQPEDAASLKSFMKKLGANVEIVDLVRYIRLLVAAKPVVEKKKVVMAKISAPRAEPGKAHAVSPKKAKKKRGEMTDLEKAMADMAELAAYAGGL